jgi:transcriptional regulator with XRE-family HTH domain
MIHRFFAETIQYYGIKARDLHEVSGVSQNHISEFKNGKGNISVNVMWKLVEGMEVLAPGSRAYFFTRLVGDKNPKFSVAQKLEQLIDQATDADVNVALLAIAKRYRAKAENEASKITEESRVRVKI